MQSITETSAGDPDQEADPQEQHVFGPPGSDHLSEVRIRVRLLILNFSHKGVERAEQQCLQNKILRHLLAKKLIFKTEDNVPASTF
jgi:hypothetical protein